MLHPDGRFEISDETWSKSPRVSPELVKRFAADLRFDASVLKPPFERWHITSELLAFRDRDVTVARREKAAADEAERAAAKHRATAESLNGVYIPAHLGEVFPLLDTLVSADIRDELRSLESRHEMIRVHHGFGTWVRNTLGLWQGSRLAQYFLRLGVVHPDEMSGVILPLYYDWLHERKDTWREWERQQTAEVARARSSRPSLGAVVQYGAAGGPSAGLFTFVPTGNAGLGRHDRSGVTLHGMAGATGSTAGFGRGLASGYFGLLETTFTITRTWRKPKRLSSDSTYLGGELGVTVPLAETVPLAMRGSIGFARRIQGASGPRGVAFTWGIGVIVPVGQSR